MLAWEAAVGECRAPHLPPVTYVRGTAFGGPASLRGSKPARGKTAERSGWHHGLLAHPDTLFLNMSQGTSGPNKGGTSRQNVARGPWGCTQRRHQTRQEDTRTVGCAEVGTEACCARRASTGQLHRWAAASPCARSCLRSGRVSGPAQGRALQCSPAHRARISRARRPYARASMRACSRRACGRQSRDGSRLGRRT